MLLRFAWCSYTNQGNSLERKYTTGCNIFHIEQKLNALFRLRLTRHFFVYSWKGHLHKWSTSTTNKTSQYLSWGEKNATSRNKQWMYCYDKPLMWKCTMDSPWEYAKTCPSLSTLVSWVIGRISKLTEMEFITVYYDAVFGQWLVK